MVATKTAKLILLLAFLALSLSGCGDGPLAECENGFCGRDWELEIDSAVARGQSRLQAQPHDMDAHLALADAYIGKASFVRNQSDSRADFWFSSNLTKIDRLLDDALTLCDKVLSRQVDAALAYDLKGRSYLQKSQLVREWDDQLNVIWRAINAHQKAVSLQPNSADMWYNLGFARQQVSYWGTKETKECFEKAIQLDPTYARSYAALGQYAIDRSGNRYLKALAKGANDRRVLLTVSDRYSDYEIWANFLATIRAVPAPVKAPFVLGFSFFQATDNEVGARLYRRITRLQYHFVKDHLSLARYAKQAGASASFRHFEIWAKNYGAFGRVGWGYNALEMMSRAHPKNPLLYYYWGEQFFDSTEATKLLQKAITFDSSIVIAYYRLAAMEAMKKDWESAERWLAEASRRAPLDEFITLRANLLRTLIYGRKGEISLAIRECGFALRIDSAYVQWVMRWGIEDTRGFGSTGLRFILDKPIGPESVRGASERRIASLLNLSAGWGYWLHESWGGDYNEFFQKAIEMDPGNLEACFALAHACRYDNDYDKAIEVIHRVIRLYPENARAHEQLAYLYLAKNRLPEAKRELQRAFELGDFSAKITLDEVEKSETLSHNN